jgi:hypothetical protein
VYFISKGTNYDWSISPEINTPNSKTIQAAFEDIGRVAAPGDVFNLLFTSGNHILPESTALTTNNININLQPATSESIVNIGNPGTKPATIALSGQSSFNASNLVFQASANGGIRFNASAGRAELSKCTFRGMISRW